MTIQKIKAKIFIGIAVIVAIIATAVTIYILTRPESSSSSSNAPDAPTQSSADWTENGDLSAPMQSEAPDESQEKIETDEQSEEYPKQTQQSDGSVEIEFTAPPAEKPEAPTEKPTADGDYTNPDAPPTYEPEETNPPETPKEEDVQSGDQSSDGKVYDKVFGWVTPGGVDQTPIDNEGDPDNIVGNMD